MLNLDPALGIDWTDLNKLKQAVSSGINFEAHLNAMFHLAFLKGNLEIIKYLNSINPANIRSMKKALSYTIYCEHKVEVIDYLILMSGGDKVFLDEVMYIAINNGYLEMVKRCFSLGISFEAHIDSFVFLASDKGFLDILTYLVLMGANVRKIKSTQINELILSCYSNCEFDCAIKLSKHPDFADEAIKKSLAKIQRCRNLFGSHFKKMKYVDAMITIE